MVLLFILGDLRFYQEKKESKPYRSSFIRLYRMLVESKAYPILGTLHRKHIHTLVQSYGPYSLVPIKIHQLGEPREEQCKENSKRENTKLHTDSNLRSLWNQVASLPVASSCQKITK